LISERWGSPLVQEEYQGQTACDKRQCNSNNSDFVLLLFKHYRDRGPHKNRSVLSTYSHTKIVTSPYYQLIFEIYAGFTFHSSTEPYYSRCEERDCQPSATEMAQEIKPSYSRRFRHKWKPYRIYFCNFPFLVSKQSHPYICTHSYYGAIVDIVWS
jgi:hypothetical protein